MPQPRKTEVCELRKETPYMGHQMPSQDGPEGENKGQKGIVVEAIPRTLRTHYIGVLDTPAR